MIIRNYSDQRRSAIITLNLKRMNRYKNLSLTGYLNETRLFLKKIKDLKETIGYVENSSIYENYL